MSDCSEARPSATVVLARDGPRAPEVYMVRRHSDLAFGDAYAFPGGVIEAADFDVADRCTGLETARADELLGTTAALAFYSAAARELFEESGVLLTEPVVAASAADDARQALINGSLTWDRFLRDAGLCIRCDAMHYFGFWITPRGRSRRYATRFFMALMPSGQSASHCGVELTDSCWASADDALAAARSGGMLMHFPTLRTLQEIARHDSADDLVSWAAACAAAGVRCIRPEIRRCDGESRIFVDGVDSGTAR